MNLFTWFHVKLSLIVQAFQKVPALKAIAPKQSEPPFVVVQAVILVLFVALGIAATGAFKDQACDPGGAAGSWPARS